MLSESCNGETPTESFEHLSDSPHQLISAIWDDINPRLNTRSRFQTSALLKLTAQCLRFRGDLEQEMIRPGYGTKMVALIGELYFLGSLEDIEFTAYNDAAKARWDNALAEAGIDESGSYFIQFNIGHGLWQDTLPYERPALFFSTLLHEAIHCYLQRHVRSEEIWKTLRHGSAWQLIAWALEQRASMDFNFQADLYRPDSLIWDMRSFGQVLIDNDDLFTYFGTRFHYDEISRVLIDHGHGEKTSDEANTVTVYWTKDLP